MLNGFTVPAFKLIILICYSTTLFVLTAHCYRCCLSGDNIQSFTTESVPNISWVSAYGWIEPVLQYNVVVVAVRYNTLRYSYSTCTQREGAYPRCHRAWCNAEAIGHLPIEEITFRYFFILLHNIQHCWQGQGGNRSCNSGWLAGEWLSRQHLSSWTTWHHHSSEWNTVSNPWELFIKIHSQFLFHCVTG